MRALAIWAFFALCTWCTVLAHVPVRFRVEGDACCSAIACCCQEEEGSSCCSSEPAAPPPGPSFNRTCGCDHGDVFAFVARVDVKHVDVLEHVLTVSEDPLSPEPRERVLESQSPSPEPPVPRHVRA